MGMFITQCRCIARLSGRVLGLDGWSLDVWDGDSGNEMANSRKCIHVGDGEYVADYL